MEKFSKFRCTDGAILYGLLSSPDGGTEDVCIIHLHGMAGNFYENSFIWYMRDEYLKKGIGFFTFNNRGHDYISDYKVINENNIVNCMGGYAYEHFEDCIHDLSGAISYVKSQGYNKIIIQGHSSGANKAVYYCSRSSESICGIALLSPCDDIAIYYDNAGLRDSIYREYATQYIDQGKRNVMMPEGTFFSYPLSVDVFDRYYHEGSPFDVFPYRDPNNTFSDWSSISCPAFVCFGTDGDYISQEPKDIFSLLKAKRKAQYEDRYVTIEGASHSYVGKESELVKEIVEWAMDLTRRDDNDNRRT